MALSKEFSRGSLSGLENIWEKSFSRISIDVVTLSDLLTEIASLISLVQRRPFLSKRVPAYMRESRHLKASENVL